MIRPMVLNTTLSGVKIQNPTGVNSNHKAGQIPVVGMSRHHRSNEKYAYRSNGKHSTPTRFAPNDLRSKNGSLRATAKR